MDWSQILIDTCSASIGGLAIVYVLAAQGLNIHYGYTGLFNFGQAGFMAVGAYGVAIVERHRRCRRLRPVAVARHRVAHARRGGPRAAHGHPDAATPR